MSITYTKIINELFISNKSGLYFQPPITIINSKNIITLIIKPTGICPELASDSKPLVFLLSNVQHHHYKQK